MATRPNSSGAPSGASFDRSDWIGLALFLSPLAIAFAHWIGGL